MIGSIDRFGRVVIPKKVRDRLGLRAGSPISIEESGGELRIAPLKAEACFYRAADGFLVLTTGGADLPSDPVAEMREERIHDLFGSDRH